MGFHLGQSEVKLRFVLYCTKKHTKKKKKQIVLSSLRLIQDYGENPFTPVGKQDVDNLNLTELNINWNPTIQETPHIGDPPPNLDLFEQTPSEDEVN